MATFEPHNYRTNTTSFEGRPKGGGEWAATVLKTVGNDEIPIAEVILRRTREPKTVGEITLKSSEQQFFVTYRPFKGIWHLMSGKEGSPGLPVATVRKLSFMKREFVVTCGEARYKLAARAAVGYNFVLYKLPPGESMAPVSDEIGEFVGEDIVRAKYTIDVEDDVAAEALSFMYWLILSIRKKTEGNVEDPSRCHP